MGKIKNLISGTSLPEQKLRQALALDAEYEDLQAFKEKSNARILTLEAEVNPLKREIEGLKQKIVQLTSSATNDLTLKYGVYWDKNGNPFCPKCKTPTTNIAWATYTNRQVHGLKCPCSEKPFILMENGEPIQAQEAMKRMTNA